VQKLLKAILFKCGYELRRVSRKTSILPVEQERTSADYDALWSGGTLVMRYLTEEKRSLYAGVLGFADELGLFTNVRSVADVGCGPGHLLKLLATRDNALSIVGFDFSTEVLQVAKTICPQAEFRKHDIYDDLPGRFDLLFCTEVLEHLSHPEKPLDNLVAGAATAVISIPNGRIDTYKGHINY
jgi:2-polyprenyl-3-methyl-5-hydroxy-6-metoxy-1,4-benzoquinol methylase